MATRNIVLIIGNGFDLDLGLKTSYKDFWESDYCPIIYPAPLIFHLNERWGEDLDKVKWYDLENELLNYYHTIDGDTSKDIIDDKELEYLKIIKPGLISYGVYQEEFEAQIDSLFRKNIIVRVPLGYDIPYQQDLLQSPLYRDRQAHEKIKQALCDYLTSIDNGPEPSRHNTPFQVFRTLVDDMDSNHTLNVYSFNYTTIPWGFGTEYNDIIHYVHGNYRDHRIIIGTRDEDMEKEYCFLQKAFDKHFSPPPIVEDLDFADEVIIYGHSLGLNDMQYFKPFFIKQSGNDQTRTKYITIITKNDESEIEIKRSLQHLTDNNLSLLMSKNIVRFIKTDDLIDDATSLNDFLVQHGTDNIDAMEIIGKIVEYKKSLRNQGQIIVSEPTNC